ncbi:MAG: HAMP domain-containing protein, partial [Actinomycetota bacterium]
MQHLLSRFSIRGQIALLVVVAGTIFAMSGAIQIAANHKVEASLQAAALERRIVDLVTEMDIGLLEARRHEKNFIIRHDAASQKEHAQAVAAMDKALGGLGDAIPASQADKRARVQAVQAAVGQYVAAFRTMVDLQKKVGLTGADGLLAEMESAARDIETGLKGSDDPRLLNRLLRLRAAQREALAAPTAATRDAVAKAAAELEAALRAAGAPDRVGAYLTAFQAAADATVAVAQAEKVMVKAHREQLEPALNGLKADSLRDMTAASERADSVSAMADRLNGAVMGGGFVLLMVVGVLLARSIYRPLAGITRVTQQLAAGDLSVAVPATDRRDEVGALSRAVEVFREGLKETDRLRQ